MNRHRFSAIASILACLLLAGACDDGGLYEEDFTKIASDGVDDRMNSYPWAMEQFDGDGDGIPEVYVGTVSNALCIQAPGMIWMNAVIPDFTFLPPVRWQCDNANFNTDWVAYYTNTIKPCHVFRGTYDEAAGTWSWAHAWDPPLSGANAVTGFRGARVFNGALYMTGNSAISYVWKTTDGVNWTKASYAGMGLYQGQTGFRGAQVFNGKLYVSSDKGSMVFTSADPTASPASWSQACSTGFVASGGGTHYESFATGTATAGTATTLEDGTKAWRANAYKGVRVRISAGTGEGQERIILSNTATALTVTAAWDTAPDATSEYEVFDPAAPDNENIWQLAVFNGQLYAITYNFVTGSELWRSADPAPGNWTRVISGGYGEPGLAFMSVRGFGDHVYVGSCTYPPLFGTPGIAVKATEILRVDAADNVELVVGEPREVGDPPVQVKPISNIREGFFNGFNYYTWYMGEYDGWFYVGTCDFNGQFYDVLMEMAPDQEPVFGAVLGKKGFDLWRTQDGVFWVNVTKEGFGNYDNYGVRNLMATQWGFMLGAGNSVDGLEVWLGKKAE